MALMASQRGAVSRVFVTSVYVGNKITFVGKKIIFLGMNKKTVFSGILR